MGAGRQRCSKVPPKPHELKDDISQHIGHVLCSWKAATKWPNWDAKSNGEGEGYLFFFFGVQSSLNCVARPIEVQVQHYN